MLSELLKNLNKELRPENTHQTWRFQTFLQMVAENPAVALRDIFQIFTDMVQYYACENGKCNLSNGLMQIENVNLERIFVDDCEEPFFFDSLFANKFIKLINGFKQGVQNTNIFLFEGPPGSGKSTFLNNLLEKFEKYTQLPEGVTYQTAWKVPTYKIHKSLNRFLEDFLQQDQSNFAEINQKTDDFNPKNGDKSDSSKNFPKKDLPDVVQFVCPNHDHPILHIPKAHRLDFLKKLIPDIDFLHQLTTQKEYEWVQKEESCSVCSAFYDALLEKLGEHSAVWDMIFVKKVHFNRKYSEGISIYNPGDNFIEMPLKNTTIQHQINQLFRNEEVQYTYSHLAKTNNGIYALMDIKENNIKRLMHLHGIISDGVHKVDFLEEKIKSLFFGSVNPADKQHYEYTPSFKDRIITINVPYILDYGIEVRIYLNKFGNEIRKAFLPNVLENIAKIIVATRLHKESPIIRQWLRQPARYHKHLDKDFLLLKMELYAGNVPAWLSEEDAKKYDDKIRKDLIQESEQEGKKGFSGRQSLNVFNALFTKYSKNEKIITMQMVENYFLKKGKIHDEIPDGFVESLVEMYDFKVMQEMKESIYAYNQEKIQTDIQNYVVSINFEHETSIFNPYTKIEIPISETHFGEFEAIILGINATWGEKIQFRQNTRTEYVSQTLAQEINMQGKSLLETAQYKKLFEKYTHNLKNNALLPHITNETFRRALQDYQTHNFNAYDQRLRQDVTQLINNLQTKFQYTEEGAKQVCVYAWDKGLLKKY